MAFLAALPAIASLAGGALSAGASAGAASANNQLTKEQLDFLKQQMSKIEGIGLPQFDTNLQAPQQMQFDKYGAPILAQGQQVNIDPQDRANQLAALGKLQGVVGGAADSEMNAANYHAMQNAAQQQRAQSQAVTQSLAARGALGSGQELAAKLAGGQNAANNSQSGMLDAAKNNALQKLAGLGQYLHGAGALREQDTSQASKNADIINQFNMANTGARNQINQMNTGLQNQQNYYNTAQNNAYQQQLLALKNNAAQQGFNNELGRDSAAAGMAPNIAKTAIDSGQQSIGLGLNAASSVAGGMGNAANSLYNAYKTSSDKEKNPWDE